MEDMMQTKSDYELQHLTAAEEAAYVDGFIAMCQRRGQPQPDRITAWVAANYSDESKRLVAEGAEPSPEDAAAFAAWLHQWRLDDEKSRRSA